MTIRKISIGTDIKSSSMNWTVGQEVIQGKYIIDSIIRRDNGEIDIFIATKDKSEVLMWKTLHHESPCLIEYSQDFSA